MALALLSPGPVSAEAGSGLIYPAQVRPRSDDGCRDPRYTRLARFWELERESSCGPFRIRGYQPLSVALVSADRVNQSPQSPAPGRQTNAPMAYRTAEARIQLSVRTKLLSGLAPSLDPALHDSLWFAYSQQSYWQILSDEKHRIKRSCPWLVFGLEPFLVISYYLCLTSRQFNPAQNRCLEAS